MVPFLRKNAAYVGWVIVIFFGGVQLLSVGLLGIYISKIFLETKRRPNYIIANSEGI